MRQIKFRGKRRYGSKWIEGVLLTDNKTVYDILYPEVQSDGKLKFRRFEVDPDTIGQFTGLVDRNGKEIYENDIVSFHRKRRSFLVMWNDDLCVYQFSDGSLINSDDNYSAIIFVVGNAFDNPELLNEKQ